MNILIAASYSAPFGGNFVGSLQDLCIRLKNRGDNVSFLFPSVNGEERPWMQWLRNSGYKVIIADLSQDAQKQVEYLKKVLNENQIDLVHLHFEIYTNLLRKHPEVFKGRKVLIHDHMGFTTGVGRAKQRVWLAAFSGVCMLHGFGVATVSKKKKGAYPLLTKKWYIPNGLSLKRNVDHISSREETRRELGIADDQKLVTIFGWDMKRKGVDIAAQAVYKLFSEGNNVVLGIIGGDVNKYHAFINQYGVDPDSPCILYIESREDVYSLHRAADVFLSASRDEGFPYAIIEAISQSTPVAVSDIPETKWALEYKKCSMYPVDDANACAEAIVKCIRFGKEPANEADIISQYSIEKWCDNILEKYDRMMRK